MSTKTDIDDGTAPQATDEQPDSYSVSADDDPLVCQYCETPFAAEQYLALHWGQTHSDALTDEERTAYEDAAEDEREAIRLFRIKAIGLLVLLYFGLLMAYAVFA